MPNIGHKWTPEEERAVVNLEWEEFAVEYPDISREAYRQRRGRLLRGSPELAAGTSLSGVSDLERAVKNNIKLARSVIRLRHSIEADDELSAAIPRIRASLQAQAQEGAVQGLTYEELRALIYGQ